MDNLWIWIGIALCLSQSAMFSGLNLALFSLGRLRLETEAEKGNRPASKILNLRQDSNLLLCTILWGNVSVNVLLALLSDSVMTGVSSFIFSTAGITFIGEIIPQAYFSRHALRIGARLTPFIRFYRILLFPVAKPCALVLDGWIGPEGPSFYREKDIEALLEKHIREKSSEISANEGRGALNFLALDDRKIAEEGSLVKPSTIMTLKSRLDLPVFPDFNTDEGQEFLGALKHNPGKWRIITDENDLPLIVLDTTEFLSRYLVSDGKTDIYRFCHRPIIVAHPDTPLDSVLGQFVVASNDRNDNVVDQDVILYWTDDQKRIITGADIFGRLLRGIAKRVPDDADDEDVDMPEDIAAQEDEIIPINAS